MKKRNKKYTPKPVFVFGGLAAFENIAQRTADKLTIPKSDADDCATAYWVSFSQLTHGDALEENWSTVACALDVGLVLCRQDVGAEYEACFISALDGMIRARERGATTGCYRLDGDALKLVTECLHVHDEQMKIATRAEVKYSLNEIYKAIKNGNCI